MQVVITVAADRTSQRIIIDHCRPDVWVMSGSSGVPRLAILLRLFHSPEEVARQSVIGYLTELRNMAAVVEHERALRLEPAGEAHDAPVLIPEPAVDTLGDIPGYAAYVLVLRPLQGQVRDRIGFPLGRGILPVGSGRRPLIPHPGLVDIGILDDGAAYPVRLTRGEVQPDRSSIVVKVEMERLDAEPREQCIDGLREARE
ncbi:MAG TPA: hypothetical protein VK929_17035 [Longimicrobiales bacterium]|nr:hypothetical protein [Longimicrobiales bacterium]